MIAKTFVRTGLAASAVLVGVLAMRMTPAAAIAPAPPAFQVQLPDTPGRDTLLKVCGLCHPAERAAAVRLTATGWEDVVADMVRRGARPTDEEKAQVLKYLTTNFLGEAEKPLNINSANQIDLEIVAGLLRREAAAVLAYLKEKGQCTALTDLKKVPGLDYKKIEERKDFLVCFPPIPAPPIKSGGAR